MYVITIAQRLIFEYSVSGISIVTYFYYTQKLLQRFATILRHAFNLKHNKN